MDIQNTLVSYVYGIVGIEKTTIKKKWPDRTTFEVGSNNVFEDPLVEPSKVLLTPLHIRLGLMKQYVKALDKKGYVLDI